MDFMYHVLQGSSFCFNRTGSKDKFKQYNHNSACRSRYRLSNVRRNWHKSMLRGEKILKMSAESSISWNDSEYFCPFSAERCLQLYSKKSQTSLSPGAMLFCPRHVLFLSFLKQARKRLISCLPMQLKKFKNKGGEIQSEKAIQNCFLAWRFLRFMIASRKQ